jgi:hypothetical protein
MLKRLAILGIFAAMLAVAPRAEAIPITGGLTFVGAASPQGSFLWSPSTSGITFGPAAVGLLGGIGSYAPVPALTPTTFTSFSFSPTFTSVVPLWNFVTGGLTYSFAMTGVSATNFDVPTTTFSLLGTGNLNITGFTQTPGVFSFSSSNATFPGPIFSFQAIQAATPVPEPGSMMLLGSGLIGLAAAARRRLANARR